MCRYDSDEYSSQCNEMTLEGIFVCTVVGLPVAKLYDLTENLMSRNCC
jgi:hypothetical protein